MINRPTPALVMQWQLIQWLNSLIQNYAMNIDDSEMNLIEFNIPSPDAENIFNGHSSLVITATGTPLLPVPNVGQRGSINAYTMVSGNVMNVSGPCTTFRLWLNNDDVTPPDDSWDGTFEETVAGVYILEGRNGFASGFIMIEVTEA